MYQASLQGIHRRLINVSLLSLSFNTNNYIMVERLWVTFPPFIFQTAQSIFKHI